MKKRLLQFATGLVVSLFTFGSFQAQAGHSMGAELTYSCASPGTYVVFLRVFRDCGGPALPNTYPLTIKAPNCNTGRTLVMNKASTTRFGNPYCSIISNTCTTTGRPNFEEAIYSATVTFTSAEQACPDWVFSSTDINRPNTINIQNPSGEPIYVEAKVKLLPGMVNNSPQFNPLSNWLVIHKEPAYLSAAATDIDGDSLVYSIQNPLRANNDPINYATYPTEIIYSPDQTKYSSLFGGTFNNTYPLISYSVDWTQPMPLFPVKFFNFNSLNGSYSFTPQKFVTNAVYSSAANKYTIVVQVDEYRKVNGAALKIGSVRRDMFVAVVENAGNNNPIINTATANGQSVSVNDIIYLTPGTPLTFQFTTADANATDVLVVTSDAAAIMPGAVFTKNSNFKPTGIISWTPAASHVRNQVYYFQIKVEDDGCPVKGQQVYTYGVKVSATGGVTGTNKDLETAAQFQAFPNPFSQELFFNVNLPVKAQSIKIYNLLGQEVDQIQLNGGTKEAKQVEWKNAGKFAAGTYVARLIAENKMVQTVKFTKFQ